ncbi:AAA family ATPase [Brucella anthropi]|uniref:AAA family ATPase n=1 Tax=Brucella anthropi TaxID=529 RepID=UPI0021657A12|nr:AAA family ATPase [Brucella anthropi]UVV67084.1 AAA family ATPase [Brucella anthropi]
MNLTQKYGPTTLAQYNTNHTPLSNLIQMYLNEKTTLPLLLFGNAGGGKTALAHLLPPAICPDFVPANDEKFIDGGLSTSINDVRSIVEFCTLTKFNSKNFTSIVIDEFDRLSTDAMDALKHALPKYQDVAGMRVHFTLTTNHINRIPTPIRDRCNCVEVTLPVSNDLLPMAMKILRAESNKDWDEAKIAEVLNTATIDGRISYREFFKRMERLLA